MMHCDMCFNHFQSISLCRINFGDWDSNIQGSWTQDRTTLSTAMCPAGRLVRTSTTCSCLKVLKRITMTQMLSGCHWQICEELSGYFWPPTQAITAFANQEWGKHGLLTGKDNLYCFKGLRLSASGSLSIQKSP